MLTNPELFTCLITSKFVEIKFMAAPILDTEFMEYWSKLSVVEKESLLRVAKNYVELKDTHANSSDFRRKLILQEREDYLQGKGKSYSWDEVKELAINPQKRNAL